MGLPQLQTKFNQKGNIIFKYEDLPVVIQENIKSYPVTISGSSNASTEQISEYFRFLQNQEALRASSYLEHFQK